VTKIFSTVLREQGIPLHNIRVLANDEHIVVYFAGTLPESYRKSPDTLNKKNRFVTMYIYSARNGYCSWLTNIRPVLASVENAVLLCCCFAFDCMYYVQNDDIQCSSDYQCHTCPTI